MVHITHIETTILYHNIEIIILGDIKYIGENGIEKKQIEKDTKTTIKALHKYKMENS